MIARIRKFSVCNKGMEALQAVILLGAGFLIIWGLMFMYEDNKDLANGHVKEIMGGNAKGAKK